MYERRIIDSNSRIDFTYAVIIENVILFGIIKKKFKKG